MKLATTIAVLLAAGAAAVAQPPHPEPGAPPGSAPRESDPAAMKARLERWLEETRHREEMIQAALKRLAEGASAEDVRRSMEPGTRQQRNGGPQPRDNSPGRARRDPPSGPPHAGPQPDFRPEQFDREQVLAFIERQSPEMAARMRAMVKESPDVADRILSRLAPQIRETMAERDELTRDIRTAQLKNGWEVMGAVRDIREAAKNGDETARGKHIQHVRELLGAGFDLRVRLHEREVTVLEERLAKLKQELLEERNGREAFIAERLKMAAEPRERRGPKPESKPEGNQGFNPEPKP